jgi:hypothetical protein
MLKPFPSPLKARLQCDLETRTPPSGGVLLNSAFAGVLAGLLAGLLRLLPRVLAGLLTLLARLVALPALLRLALVVLAHMHLQCFCEIQFECPSFKLPTVVVPETEKY